MYSQCQMERVQSLSILLILVRHPRRTMSMEHVVMMMSTDNRFFFTLCVLFRYRNVFPVIKALFEYC